jgi:imidazolonepropionase-like amidohydrolase
MKRSAVSFCFSFSVIVLLSSPTFTAAQSSSEWSQGQQYDRLVIRGAMVVNGRGTPTEGPMDIVIENERIVDIIPVDSVSLHRLGSDFQRVDGGRVIDASGMYVLPGLTDMHAHIPGDGGRAGDKGFSYAYKLWLAHGVTTLRDAGDGAGIENLREHRRLAESTTAAIPRLLLYERWPNVSRQREHGHTPDEARTLVRKFFELGADGIKVSKGPGQFPDVIEAVCDEVKTLGMNGVAVDLKVSETDAAIASNAGVSSVEHWYGVPDAAIPGTQRFPAGYNYWNEEDRFRWAGHLWKEANAHPEKIVEVLELMIANGTVWDPTMVVYEANRDLARARHLPWHEKYTVPELMAFWSPNPANHGSYHARWTTADEIAWKENFDIWTHYVKTFFDMGGTLTVGSDAGSLYALYGFSTIRELEILQEAGIHPIDIIQIATLNAARSLGLDDQEGIRIGEVADLAIVDGNPLENFKVMYGTGIQLFHEDGSVETTGGVAWTIKRGVVFDAKELLREVEAYVAASRGAPVTN